MEETRATGSHEKAEEPSPLGLDAQFPVLIEVIWASERRLVLEQRTEAAARNQRR